MDSEVHFEAKLSTGSRTDSLLGSRAPNLYFSICKEMLIRPRWFYKLNLNSPSCFTWQIRREMQVTSMSSPNPVSKPLERISYSQYSAWKTEVMWQFRTVLESLVSKW